MDFVSTCNQLEPTLSVSIFSTIELDLYPNIIAMTKTSNNIKNNKNGVNFIPFICLIYSICRK